MDIVNDIRSLVALKKGGELSADEFTKAKAALFSSAASGPGGGKTEEQKNADGEKRRARRRSVKDWLTRIGQDCAAGQKETEELDGYVDKPLSNMFALGIKFSGPGYVADGKYRETVVDFFEEGAKATYKVENLRPGVKDSWSGVYQGVDALTQLITILLDPSKMEWQYNVRDAKIVRYDDVLVADFGYTPLISKKTGKEYEVYVKHRNTYNADQTKLTSHQFTLADPDGFFALVSDDGLEEALLAIPRV